MKNELLILIKEPFFNASELKKYIAKNKKNFLKSINEKNEKSGFSVLATASTAKKPDMAQILIEHGADLNTQDRNGKTPLHYAAERNNYEIAKILINNGAKVNIDDKNNNQPLGEVVFCIGGLGNDFSLVKLLLENGADPKHKNNFGVSALDLAKNIQNEKLIELLVQFQTGAGK